VGELSLEEKVFRDHMARGSFVRGVELGHWHLVSLNWPIAIIAITAVAREKGPDWFALRFDLTGYPSSPPTSRPWSKQASQPLEPGAWPTGVRRVAAVFNPGWNNGIALYLPCDRVAAAGHTNWTAEYPYWIWSPTDTIVKYLRIVHELLNSNDYAGVRS
jgi:hypothetical protein